MIKKTVSDYLNSIDYRFNGYIPKDSSLDFISFIKLVNGGEGEENKTPVVHYKLLDSLFTSRKRLAIMSHRGFSKTTIIAEYLFMYIAVYGKIPEFGEVNLALYVADSADGGAKNLRKNIEFRYHKSDFMQKYVPTIRFTDTRLEFTNLENKTLVVKMYGGQSNIRGTKEQGVRPQLAIMDDLYSDQDAKSSTVIENINNNVYKAIGKSLHPNRSKMVLIGTPFNTRDTLYQAVESGAWDVAVYPICEKFPCSKEEFRGSWEDRFSYEYVKDEYDTAIATGQAMSFFQELMLQITSDEDRLVLDDDIVWYKRKELLKYKSNYNYYITTDFAVSEKSSADYSVISVWAISSNGDMILIDSIVNRQLMDKNIDDLFRWVSRYKPLEVGIEITGQQGGFIQWIKSEMIKRNIFFNIAKMPGSNIEGIRPNKAKLERFMDILPRVKNKKLWLPEEMKDTNAMNEILDELRNSTKGGFKSRHDDWIDTLTMLGMIDLIKPSETYYEEKNDIQYSTIWEDLPKEVDSNNSGLIF